MQTTPLDRRVSTRRRTSPVWQPLAVEGTRVEAIDGAIHTFHDLSDRDFDSVLSQMRSINANFKPVFQAHRSLQVHPVLKEQGYRSRYFQRLAKLIVASSQRSSLSRIALMELHAFGEFWDFFAVDINSKGEMTPVRIPGFAATTVEFSNIFQRPDEAIAEFKRMNPSESDFVKQRESIRGRIAFRGDFGPGGGSVWKPGDDGYKQSSEFFGNPLIRFLADSDTFPENGIRQLNAKIDEINDPSRHLPGTIDCVSCHATHTISAFFRGNAVQAKSLRAFGYFKDTASISQRTKNETETIVRYLNQ